MQDIVDTFNETITIEDTFNYLSSYHMFSAIEYQE